MAKRVLDVGNCTPDHLTLSAYLQQHFQAELTHVHDHDGALEQLREATFDLVLINRKMDRDHSDGMEIVRAIKSDHQLQQVPVMMITNYADHQEAAVEAGAEPGFGKLEYGDPQTREKLARFLSA